MAKETKYPARKLAYFSDEMAKAIDDYRYANRIPSENEAIRRLIHTGLAARPILKDLLRLIEHLPADSDMERHAATIKEALGE